MFCILLYFINQQSPMDWDSWRCKVLMRFHYNVKKSHLQWTLHNYITHDISLAFLMKYCLCIVYYLVWTKLRFKSSIPYSCNFRIIEEKKIYSFTSLISETILSGMTKISSSLSNGSRVVAINMKKKKIKQVIVFYLFWLLEYLY